MQPSENQTSTVKLISNSNCVPAAVVLNIVFAVDDKDVPSLLLVDCHSAGVVRHRVERGGGDPVTIKRASQRMEVSDALESCNGKKTLTNTYWVALC